MSTRHHATMETGGWVLLVAAIVALIYFFFAKKTASPGASVSSTVAPTSGVPKITSDIADEIANGIRSARVFTPGSGSACGSGETIMDAGSGNLWCVSSPSQAVYGTDTFRSAD